MLLKANIRIMLDPFFPYENTISYGHIWLWEDRFWYSNFQLTYHLVIYGKSENEANWSCFQLKRRQNAYPTSCSLMETIEEYFACACAFSAYLVSEPLTAVCSGISLGCLYSEQPWKVEMVSSCSKRQVCFRLGNSGFLSTTQPSEQAGTMPGRWYRSYRGVQPAVHGPHAPQDGCECGPTQSHKFT